MARVKAANLTVGWNQTAVAKLDQFEVNSGEIVVIAGPNGAGKSTIVKTIARQISPMSGSVTIDDQDIAQMAGRQFARQIGYVAQVLDFPRHMTVENLVAMGRNPHQQWWSWEMSAVDRSAVDTALQRTELELLRKKPITALSGGERQRAAIAMALAQETRFILLDEPTAYLDFKHQLQLLELLHQLRGNGIGLVVVLHDLNLTARLADSVVLLTRPDHSQPGSIARAGSVEQVLNEETLRQVYGVDVSIVRDDRTHTLSFVPVRQLSD